MTRVLIETPRDLVDSKAMARIESLSYRSNSPLAFCPAHGLFVITGMEATGNAKLSFSHCATNCPTCGSPSEILPGLYEPDGANIRLLLDPGVSAEALESLQKLLLAVVAGEMTPEQATKEAEKVHSGWGKLFDLSRRSTQSVALAGALIGAIGVITAARISSPPSVTVLVNPPAIIQSIVPKNSGLLGSTSLTPPPSIHHGHPPHPHKHKGRH